MPPVSYTKTTLSYPVYSADFDPYNRGYLVVGGGGGAGRHGVGNKIVSERDQIANINTDWIQTLLDTTSRDKLQVAAEIDLSKDEDSVTSLANLASRDGLISLAGINSTEEEQKTGKNEHLRGFSIQYPRRKRQTSQPDDKDDDASSGQIAAIGKTSLFRPATGPKPETYQRLLRLSPARRSEVGSKRIGAIASGLAKQSEIVVFDATMTPPSHVITRIDVPAEAADMDIAESMPSTFSLAWCTDYDVYEQTIEYNFATRKAEFSPKGPRRVHSIPNTDNSGQAITRAKYRSLRFLTDHHVLVMSNLPNKSGAELFIMHLYPTGPAAVLFHKILPSHIKQGMGMDVCRLDGDQDGSRQFVVAVGGQDISIEVYTINYNRPTDTFAVFRKFTTLRDVHPLQMTALTLSQFHSPIRAPPPPEKPEKGKEQTASSDPSAHPGPQYIRMASTSMGNTVVVDTFALSPLQPGKRDSRYVLSHPSDEKFTQRTYIALISFIVLMSALVLQGFLYPDSNSSLSTMLPAGARQYLAMPANAAQGMGKSVSSVASDAADALPTIETPQRIKDILHAISPRQGAPNTRALVLRDSETTDVSIDVIPDKEEYLKQDAAAKHWHEMEEHEQHKWREALIKAGHWTLDEGETILKGVLFSSYAGLVGQAAAQAMN